MSGTRILFPEFRDEQSDSRYPFADTATLIATDGVTTILRDMFIDAALHPIGATDRLYLSRVVVEQQNIILKIGDRTNAELASTSFNPARQQLNTTDTLTLTDVFGRPAGALVAATEKLILFSSWSLGTYNFLPAATEFSATVCIPAQEPGVRGVLTDANDLIADDLWLIGDGGVVIRHEGLQNGYQIIRVDIVGVPLFSRFVCIPFERFAPKNFVRTINNCPPDEYGNFTLTATGFEVEDTVLRISNRDGIIFIDAVGRKVV
jgi:hypothetical protein